MTLKFRVKEIPTENEVYFTLSHEGLDVGEAHIYRLGRKPYGWKIWVSIKRQNLNPEKVRIYRDGDIGDFKNTADALDNITRVMNDAFGYDLEVKQDD